ncbi:polysaccharide lyase [Mesorhizobium sp. BAC0120]|uniref:polysaccharide lyase n=1 Tax=Mesorhizobium sp. BAC0120 TaxID=3090670 RepID=UPI00399999BA
MKNAIRWAGLAAFLLCGAAQAEDWAKPLFDGFDGSDFSPAGGLYYRENFEQSAGTVEFQKAVKLSGAGALKLSVKALCPTDDDGCSERAEIWEKTALRVPYDQGVWYGFAVKFGDPIPIDDHRYLIAQWKREIIPGAEGDFSPFLALRLRNGKLFATVETNYVAPDASAQTEDSSSCCGGKMQLSPQHASAQTDEAGCPEGAAPVWFRPETNQMRALVATDSAWTAEDNDLYHGCTKAIRVIDHGNKLPLPSSGWIDFEVFTKPGPDGTGRIEIFANDKPVVTVEGHIGHADHGLGNNQYFKFGPYRAGHSDDWTLYYDHFRRSPHCADVLSEGSCPLP